MLEGLPPHRPTHILRLDTDERSARAMTDLLGEMFDPTETAVAAFEDEDGKTWRLEAYFADAPDEDFIRDLIRPVIGAQADVAEFRTIAEQDWVRASLEGLKPVRAGRFLIHGSHDREVRRANDLAIEIEAALAFGTGHHGTTLGCLRAYVAERKRRRRATSSMSAPAPASWLFAAAKELRQPVVAGDLDGEAVITARENARLNGLGPWLKLYHAAGTRHRMADRRRHFDLVFANILAKPLRLLAPSLAGVVSEGGTLVLSGLIERDVPGVLSAYRHQGFALAKRGTIEGWVHLVLRRGGAAPRRR